MRGSGRIYLRGQYYWVAYFLRGDEIRVPAKDAKGRNTGDAKVAEAYLKKCRDAATTDKGGGPKVVTPKQRKATIGDLLGALKADFTLRKILSSQTASHLERAVKDFGRFRAVELTPQDIDDYIQKRLTDVKKPAKPATINRVTQMISTAFQLAVRNKTFSPSQVPYVRHLDESDNICMDFFTETQFRGVVDNLPADLRDYVRFAAACGVRKGELSAYRWDMLKGSTLHIPAAICKNKKGRVLPLIGEMLAIVERQKSRRQVERNGVAELCPYIFHRDGEVGPVGEFRKSWKSACKKAGCVGKFHGLRRFAARALRDAHVPQVTAMKITGHVTDAMWRRYSIVCEDDMRDALTQTEKYREAEAARAANVPQVVSMGEKR